MFKTILKLLLGSALLIALQACGGIPTLSSPVPTLDPNYARTAIARTFAAAATQTAVGIPITGKESATPTPTATLMETPTPSLPPTSSFSPTPAFTATSSVLQVSVSVATNCRTGPGIGYPRIGGLLVGQMAEVVGRNSTNTYWIIQDPNRPGETCWLWGQFATLTGDAGSVPVFTPPPPPVATGTPTPMITLTPATTSTSPTTPAPSMTPTPTATP